MSRIPRPLLLLLPAVLVCGTLWAFFTPLWQAPDEPQHFAYVESLVERGSKPDKGLPIDGSGQAVSDRTTYFREGETSSETQRLLDAANTYLLRYDGYARPPWSETVQRRYLENAREGRRDDGGRTSYTSANQPLYYLVESIPYRVASGGTAIDRLFLMRWFSALWLLVAAVGGWLLAGEVFGRRRLPQLVTAATLGMWPMLGFISGAINPDGQLAAICTLALWLAVRVARRGTDLRSAVALVVLVALAFLTKSSGAALAPAAGFAILAGLPRARAWLGDRVPRILGLGAGLVVGAAVLLLAGNALGVLPTQLDSISGEVPDPNRFLSYLWQFYLPNPGFMNDQRFLYPVISDTAVINTWFGMTWGVYGWVNVWFATWIYHVLLGIAIVVLVAAGVAVVRAFRARVPEQPGGTATVAITLALAVLGVLGGVHLFDYNALVAGDPPFAQGRYLFPVAGVAGLVVGAAVLAGPQRARPAIAAAWLGFLVVFQVASLSLVAGRFYA